MSLLRPIQYTGALFDGLGRFQRRAGGGDARRRAGMSSDGLLEFVMPLCGVATQPDRSEGGGQRERQRGAADAPRR